MQQGRVGPWRRGRNPPRDCVPSSEGGSLSASAGSGSAAGTSARGVSASIAATRASEAGAAASSFPRPWMAFQMRSVATFRFVNLVTGLTPGRLFQISTSRLLSGPIRSANCTSFAKAPKPVPGSVDCDVVFCVNGEVFHVVISWRGNYRGDHIHHSGPRHKQENSARDRKGDRKAMVLQGQVVSDQTAGPQNPGAGKKKRTLQFDIATPHC